MTAVLSKCIISLRIFFSTPIKCINQKTKCIVMITKEGSTMIVNFMPLGRLDHIHALSSTLSIYNTLIAIIVFKDYNAVYLYHCWFSLILWWGCWHDGAVDMLSLLDKSQCSLWYSGDHKGLWASSKIYWASLKKCFKLYRGADSETANLTSHVNI